MRAEARSESLAPKPKRKTDPGTIALHWSLVATLSVCLTTGLKIAADGPDAGLLGMIAAFLPASNVWFLHIVAGVGVMALAAAYPIYIHGSGLTGRLRLDGARLARIASEPWAALNVMLYWLLFALLATQVVTGLMLHRGFGGATVALHLFVTWMILLYTLAHVLAHAAHGGLVQLLRVLRPASRQAGKTDALVPRSFRIAGATLAAAAAVGVGWFEYDRLSRDTLIIARVASAPSLSGDLTQGAWRAARPLRVRTQQGANLEDTGEASVEIRAVHDGVDAWFAFTWEDSTRSTKHFPLVKGADGWRLLMHESQAAQSAAELMNPGRRDSAIFEGAYAEDKFSVMLTPTARPFGPGAFHPGARPLPDKPASASGRGLHYTTDGDHVDVWLWHAAAGPAAGRCETGHIGGPQPASPAQTAGLAPYRGGVHGAGNKASVPDNFRRATAKVDAPVIPLRLPADLAASQAATGPLILDSDQSEGADARWAMSEADSVPYSPMLDALIPAGAIIPGLLVPQARPFEANDVACAAHWAANRWTLIAKRKLDTGDPDDIALAKGAHMFVAVFDHTAARHTRHIRPIKLEVAP